mgnify:CR=1 FL=1
MIIIFIGGASGAGKSSLSRELAKRLADTCQLISMDDYFHPIPENYPLSVPDNYLPSEDRTTAMYKHFRAHTNFDHPDRFNFERLTLDLTQLSQGEEIQKGIFDFTTNTYPTHEIITPPKILILEGLYALTFAATLDASLQKLTVFTSTSSYQNLIKRRIQRDIEKRGLTEAEVRSNEKKYVGPAFFGSRIANDGPASIVNGLTGADVHILNDKLSDIQAGADEVLEALSTLMAPTQNLSAAAASQCGL